MATQKKKTSKVQEENKKNRKKLVGQVTSIKMAKTVTVEVLSKRQHPLYKKVLTRRKKYKAHTIEKLAVGDQVIIESTRPISKTKKWKVLKKL